MTKPKQQYIYVARDNDNPMHDIYVLSYKKFNKKFRSDKKRVYFTQDELYLILTKKPFRNLKLKKFSFV